MSKGCRWLIARLLWDAVVEFVRCTGEDYEDAASFLYSPGGRILFEEMNIDPDAALDHIQKQRWQFQKLALLAYVDPKYKREAQEWWYNFYGRGFVVEMV